MSVSENQYGLRNKIGLFLGPLVFVVFVLTSPPDGMPREAWCVAGVALLMAIYWITEAISIPVTAMFPIALFPLLGVADVSSASAPYAHKLIFLFLGGFLLALAIQRWNLHKRLALYIIKTVGTSPNRIIGGFMVATASLSMWVSNTATTMMMFPIAMSVIYLLEDSFTRNGSMSSSDIGRFALCLMLCIAYAANVGGIGTVIGTAPNAFMKAYLLEEFGYDLTFAEWMFFALPFVLMMLLLIYFILTQFLFHFKVEANIPGVKKLINDEIHSLGNFSRGEKLRGCPIFC